MTYSVRNIAIALALAVAAAAAVLLYTSSYKDQVTRDQERVRSWWPTRTSLPARPARRPAGMMAAKEVLRTDVTPGALQSSAGLEGKVAAHDVYADQQIVAQVFRTPTDQAAALSLDKTERGIRINVDFASGALGAIKAGDHVDYFATFSVKPPGDTAGNRLLHAPPDDRRARSRGAGPRPRVGPRQALARRTRNQAADPDAGGHPGRRYQARVRRGPQEGRRRAPSSPGSCPAARGPGLRDADHGREPRSR